jgi:hypothetical protein
MNQVQMPVPWQNPDLGWLLSGYFRASVCKVLTTPRNILGYAVVIQ